MRTKKFPQLAKDVRIDRWMSPTLAWWQASSVERRLRARVRLAPTLVNAHTVEAAGFAEVEKVLGDSVPQAEKLLDSTQFLRRIGDEVFRTEEVELFEGEVVQPARQMNVVHWTPHRLIPVVDLARVRVDN